VRIEQEYERGVIFPPGRLSAARRGGLFFLIPIIDACRIEPPLRPDTMTGRPRKQYRDKSRLKVNASSTSALLTGQCCKQMHGVSFAHHPQLAQTTLRSVFCQTDWRNC
jgi:regulator of protease activity HflC (stomatin/prohibitin superfamily)